MPHGLSVPLIAGGSAEDGPSGGAFAAELSVQGIADYRNGGSAFINIK